MVDNNNKNVGQIRLNGETQCTINITVLVAIKEYWLQAIKNVPNVARIISVAHMAFGYFAYSSCLAVAILFKSVQVYLQQHDTEATTQLQHL